MLIFGLRVGERVGSKWKGFRVERRQQWVGAETGFIQDLHS